MWAQLIKTTLKPGTDAQLESFYDYLRDNEPADSGLLRTIAMRDQQDPSQLFTLVYFESEEKARAREQDPNRPDAAAPVQALAAEIFDGPPEFYDLQVLRNEAPASRA